MVVVQVKMVQTLEAMDMTILPATRARGPAVLGVLMVGAGSSRSREMKSRTEV